MGEKNRWFEQLRQKRRRLADQLKDPAASGLWKSVIDKYSDNAHFIYELLQNSDDACATEVAIHFCGNTIEYIHNGEVKFSLSDPAQENVSEKKDWGHINSLTAIGSSNKLSDRQIGRFGVGFKSVFKYVDSPVVEDDNYCFVIHDFIVPEVCEPKCKYRNRGETAFLLPLTNPPEVSVIREKASTLNFSLLFLPHLKEVKIYEDDKLVKIYKKRIIESWAHEYVQCEKIGLMSQSFDMVSFEKMKGDVFELESSWFYLFSFREGETSGVKHEMTDRLSVAMKITESGQIEAVAEEPLYCFFPTQEYYHQPVLLNAPFLLSESREAILENEETNDKLFRNLGRLLVRSVEALVFLPSIKKEVLRQLLGVFPCKEKVNKTRQGKFLECYIRGVADELKQAALFRTITGTVKRGDEVVLTEDWELQKLFSAEELEMIFPEYDSLSYLSSDYYEKKHGLADTLLKLVEAYPFCPNKVVGETFLERLSPPLLGSHPLEWFVEFYSFLKRKKMVHAQIKNLPLFLCDDWCCRRANEVFLSSGTEGFYHAVHAELLKNESCVKFFEMMGISHPGTWAEINEVILPAYRNAQISVEDEVRIGHHLQSIFEYYQSQEFYSSERVALLAAIKDVSLLPVVNLYGEKQLARISECYMQTNALKSLLKNCEGIKYFENTIVEKYIKPEDRKDFYVFLSAAGLRFGLNLKREMRISSLSALMLYDLHPRSLRQTDDGAQEIEDVLFEDVDTQEWDEEKSQAFYILLNQEIQKQSSFLFLNSLYGKYRYVEKGKRNHTEEPVFQTTAWRAVFRTPWMLGRDGKWHQPSEIGESGLLADLYDKEAVDLLFFLNIKISDEPLVLTKEQKQALSFVEDCRKRGILLSDIERAVEIWEKNRGCEGQKRNF